MQFKLSNIKILEFNNKKYYDILTLKNGISILFKYN